MPDVTTIPNVELARVGSYDLSTGPYEFTRQDLAAAITNAATGTQPRIKLGHVDPRFDGEPAIGVVTNMRLEEDGDVLVGDLANVPAWLADAMPAAYPGRSIEATVNPELGMRITALALLGMTRPGIDTLADLEYALAAAARANPEDPGVVQVAVSLTQLRASAQDKAADPASPNRQEETIMDENVQKILVAQGLDPATATEDQINQASVIAVALSLPGAEPVVEPVAEVIEPAVVEPAAEVEPVVETVEDPIAVAAAAALADTNARLAAAEADIAARNLADQTARRDGIVQAAVLAGRIAPAQRDHYRSLLDIDEARTADLLTSLAASVPLGARGEIPAEDVAASAVPLSDSPLLKPHQRAALVARGL
jgi:hypothetical protein